MVDCTPKSPARWAIYSTFDALGRRALHALEQLETYRNLGFGIVVVDTSPALSDLRRQDWQSIADSWLQRENIGYDFGSYRAGIEHLTTSLGVDLSDVSLLLANDSCFGPFIPMQRVFSWIEGLLPSDTIFGITDSFEVSYHLQSYWLYFPKPAGSVAWKFLRTMPMAKDRDEAIRHGELYLSKYAMGAGYGLRAYADVAATIELFAKRLPSLLALVDFGSRFLVGRYRYNRKADARCIKRLLGRRDYLKGFNPTIGFGIAMCRLGLSPFLKRSLLKDNPYGDRSVPRNAHVASWSNGDVGSAFGFRPLRDTEKPLGPTSTDA